MKLAFITGKKMNKRLVAVQIIFLLIISCSISLRSGGTENLAATATATTTPPPTPTAIRSVPTRIAEWVVCTDALHIRTAPKDTATILGFLENGTPVYVREWSHNGNGWAMIAPAKWVNGDYLCRNPQWHQGVPTPFLP